MNVDSWVVVALTTISLMVVKLLCLATEKTRPESDRRSRRKETHMTKKLSAIAVLETVWTIGVCAIVPASRASEPTNSSAVGDNCTG
jgi:hypothetical protein